MIISASDIMSVDPITITPVNTLKDAHEISKRMGIRHLPIVSEQDGKLIGLLTQRAMTSKAMSLLTKYGAAKLGNEEAKINVMSLAATDFQVTSPDMQAGMLAPYFLENKYGCLPVVDDNNQLLGIITSSDFVKLSIRLLNAFESKA